LMSATVFSWYSTSKYGGYIYSGYSWSNSILRLTFFAYLTTVGTPPEIPERVSSIKNLRDNSQSAIFGSRLG